MHLARLLPVATLALGLLAIGQPASAACPAPDEGPPGCQSGPVPAEWGEPSWEHAGVVVVGGQVGRLPGRPGDQHVTQVNTLDEEGVVAGAVHDWYCPAGAVAPTYPQEASPCRLKATADLGHDPSRESPGGDVVRWGPSLRYVNYRLPVLVTPTAGGDAEAERGWLSLRLRADGAVTQSWYAGDHVDILERGGARVVGGHVAGTAWLGMDAVTVDAYYLYREYYPEG